MGHWALLNSKNKVVNVIVADTVPDSLKNKGTWVQTSYNTVGGVHSLGGTPLRKNFASVGGSYDSERDAFIPRKPYASWVLNEETCLWEAPVAKPEGDYVWNELLTSWVLAPQENN